MKIIISFLFVLIGIYFIIDNNKSQEIKIAFVGALSGKYSYLGHNVLNGIKLALDNVNYKINNIEILLLEKDDKQNKNEAYEIIKNLQKDNISIVIGNTTSSMTSVSIKEIKDNENILLISPTASSSEFTNKDDNFLRTQVSTSSKNFDNLSKHLLSNNIKNLIIVYDPENSSYSKNFLEKFQNSFENNGGNKFKKTIMLNNNLEIIYKNLKNLKFDGIVVVANSFDSAKIIQFLKIKKLNKKFIVSGWAKSQNFLENGGKYLDGVILTTTYNDLLENTKYLEFYKQYKNKYNQVPTIFAAQAYETVNIILEILKKDNNTFNLKKNILKTKVFEGLQGNIIFNKFGDVERKNFLIEVKNNRFMKVD
ncbi:MAG: ABC transporter substrate-binding protein [Arcobacter sp.]|nr:ABC transporter substrate-binding protein [Arcobacter sp.]